MPRGAALFLFLMGGCAAPGAAPQPAPARPSAAPAAPSAQPALAAPSASAAPSVASATATAPAPPPEPRHFAGGGPASVSGTNGIVTSSEAQATRAGVSVLEHGGNAVDAA